VRPAGQNYYESSYKGALWAWSWDDGDPNTWEGTISLDHYESGETLDLNAQIAIPSGGPHEPIWSYMRRLCCVHPTNAHFA
jgi:hypothetical protein